MTMTDDVTLAIDAAVAAERERCAKIARNGARGVRNLQITITTPARFAADLADDIADLIESGAGAGRPVQPPRS